MSPTDQAGAQAWQPRPPARSRTPLALEAAGRPGVVADRHAPRDRTTRHALAVADAIALLTALLLVSLFTARRNGAAEASWGLLMLPVWLLLFRAYGLYERDSKRISHSTLEDVPWLTHALITGSLLTWLYYHLTIKGGIEFRDLLAFACATFAGVLVSRPLARRIVSSSLGPERVLLVGEGESVTILARKMRSHPEYGVLPVARIAGGAPEPDADGLPVLGDLHELDLCAVVIDLEVERMVIANGEVDVERMLELLRRCKELSIKVSVLPQLCDAMGPSVEIDDVEGVTLLGVNPPVLSPSSWLVKRCMDVVGAAVILLVGAVPMGIIAIAIRIDSRGPVLFRQIRVGKGGRRFGLLKFRTMVVGAETMTETLREQSVDPHWLHLEHDPRITRVGRLLRASSLDELPQVWNVLKGQMSLVGPRPLVEAEDQQIIGWARSRIDLTPGLTGLWQVLGRTSIPFEEMIKLDYIYVTNWSLWTDIRLILRTLPVVVSRRGAN